MSESAVFAYESSVHSTNVLLSLNDQRKKDVLCDVTVVVEGQRFRAHRSVLAACSSYFHSRIVGQTDAELTITLPEEVRGRRWPSQPTLTQLLSDYELSTSSSLPEETDISGSISVAALLWLLL